MDVPALDKKPNLAKPFTVRNGMLVSLGKPAGHLLTEKNIRITALRLSTGLRVSPVIVESLFMLPS